MKTRRYPDSHGARLLRLMPALALLCFLPHPLSATGGPAAAAGPPPVKPYTLYLGANLVVEWHGKLWPVCGVQRDSFVIEAGGRRVRVSDTDLKMKIDRTLKLTTTRATIAGVKAERAYSPANNPRHHASQAMMLAGAAADDSDVAAYKLNNMTSVNGREEAFIPTIPPDWGKPTPQFSAADIANASAAYQQNLAAEGSEINSVADANSREQTELGQKLFDAFSLSFKISAAKPLENPYLVVFVRFRDKGGEPKTTRLAVYGQVLPVIDGRPHEVRLFRWGLPPGYQLEDYQIHLYDRGVEIATSAAPNKMAMTTDEAFQYSVADYVVQNRDKTLAPTPARAFWPRNLSKRLTASELDRPLYVKVGADGRVAGFYDNQACTRPLRDADLEAVRPELHFQPALKKGKPVEGVVEFNLGRRIE